MPKRTIFTTALIAALVIGSAALAQTTPTNPQPSPTDPTCTDQVTGAGTDCINPANPEAARPGQH
jgi:hypothetical protein